jgi:translocation and assembly module TamB
LRANLATADEDPGLSIRLNAKKFDVSFLSPLLAGSGGLFAGLDGSMSGEINVAGTASKPEPHGELELTAKRISLGPPLSPLQNGKLGIRLQPERASVSFKAESGASGGLEAKASASFPSPDRVSFDASLVTRSFYVFAGPTAVAVDIDLAAQGRTHPSTAVAVSIKEGLFRLPSGKASELHEVSEMQDLVFLSDDQPAGTNPNLSKAKAKRIAEGAPLDIRVKTKSPIPIHGQEIHANVETDLHISRKSGPIRIQGLVRVGQGQLELFGRRWAIDRANLIFSGGAKPNIDVKLSFDGFETAVLQIFVSGDPARPELRFASEPPIYDQPQILSFVLGASPDSGSSGSAAEGKAAGAAAGFLMGPIQNEVRDKLPIDTLKVDVGEGAQAESLTLGKWITNKIFIAYSYRFQAETEENTNEATLQYRFWRRWTLETRYGDRGSGSADLLWIKRF